MEEGLSRDNPGMTFEKSLLEKTTVAHSSGVAPSSGSPEPGVGPLVGIGSASGHLGFWAALITVVIWTGFIVVARATADPTRGGSLTPWDVVYARILGASLVLLPWGAWLNRRDRQSGARTRRAHGESSLAGLSPLSLRRTLQTGIFGGLLYAICAYSGFVYAPAAHASVLVPGSLPLWTALLAVMVLGESIAPWRLVGLACIVCGDLLVGGASLLHAFDGGDIWRGDLLFISSSIAWSIYSVLVRRFSLDPVRATIAITSLAFVVYVPAYTLLAALGVPQAHIFNAPLHEVAWQMLSQGVFSVAISGITFNLMIRRYGPVRSTMLTAIVPGLSAVCAAAFLGEPLAWNLILGLALVTSGILFGVWAGRR